MPRIVRIRECGGPEVLKLEEQPVTEPVAGEVRIKVHALGLNQADLGFRCGRYLEQPTVPARIGYEAAGVIDAVGAGVTDFKLGDRVSTIPAFSMNANGVYGESASVPARAVAHIPDELSFTQGAAIWMQYLTAWGALVRGGTLQRGDAVVITAASSSVGVAAIQICRTLGVTTIATTRRAGKQGFLAGNGADHVVVTDEEELAPRVMQITGGEGAAMAFDPIAGPFIAKTTDCLRRGGTAIQYGALSTESAPFPLWAVLAKSLTIRGYTLFEFTSDPGTLRLAKQFVYAGLKSGALHPVINERSFALDDIVAAHEFMESNEQTGKVVVTVRS